jgi:PAS domain S-box-containing protein
MSLKTFEHSIPPHSGVSDSARPIRAEEWKFLNLADHMSQIVCVVTPQGNGRYFNPYWQNYTGLSERESLDFGWMRAFHREDLDSFIKLLRRSIAPGGWEFEARIKLANDGSYRRHLCRCSLLAGRADGSVNLVISCTDVEEWRKAEAIAKEQGALLGLSLRTHDEEKRQIAHGLNDSAGQYLVALQMKLDSLQRSSVAATGPKNPIVDECRELIKRCYREIRATSHLLYPPLLDDLGLEAAVHLHVDRFMERTKVKVELDIEPNLGRLDRDLEIALFRVVQEALATTHRQSAAKSAQIKIGAGPTSIFVEVATFCGTDGLAQKFMPSPRTSFGVGLATLRQRILEVGGLFEIVSPADGMAIRAVVPRRALVAHPCD